MPLEIRELMQQVRRLRPVAPRRVADRLGGEYHSVFKGRGIEFDEVREYAYGDDTRGIDWNVTARMGRPYVKRYREEHELTMILLVDVSGSLAFGARRRDKAETSAELACLLALSADRNNDRVGLITFGDRIEKCIPPVRRRRAVMRVLLAMPAAAQSGRRTDIAGALRFLNRVRKRRAIVFLISDFLDDGYEPELERCARRHDLLCCRIIDPFERALPDVGLIDVADPESGVVRTIDTAARATRESLRAWAAERDRLFEQSCRRARIDAADFPDDLPVIDVLHDLFRRRRRRVRAGERIPT